VNVADYELIDLFNWQDEVKGMISQLEYVDENGRVRAENIVNYFMDFYTARKERGLVVEKKSSL